MTKSLSKFVCQQCDYSQPRWFGKCPQCGSWNSAVETFISEGQRTKNKGKGSEVAKPVSLASISTSSTKRILTKIPELDRVLGGGLVPGQVVLIAGEPGTGKSTLLLQVADNLACKINYQDSQLIGNSKTTKSNKLINSIDTSVLYVSGEESVNQIKIRADRLKIKNNQIQLLEETDVDAIVTTINQLDSDKNFLSAVVIDSVQTISTTDLSGMAGSVGQVRESAFRLVRLAKEKNVPIFIVGHVTKEGTVAGPSVLMHIVDTVLWFEGDKSLTLRLLRAVKNRFGPTDEVGVFQMEDKGLQSIVDPEKIFLDKGKSGFAGDATSCILQGTRPILVEVQSLVVPTKMVFAKRVSQGIDVKRLEMLLAVLTRRCGLPFFDQDVFVNVTGGISVKNDPSLDFAIALSCASSFFNKPLKKGILAIGEVGLLGDIREVVAQEKRIKEAKRLGFSKVITNNDVKYIQEAIKIYLRQE